MTLVELLKDTQDFMSYYVNGANAPGAQAAFPGSNFGGINFRKPARRDIRPEYTPVPDALDGADIAAGAEGPEGFGPYLFLDRCPLRKANVTIERDSLLVELVFVTQYPPGRFPDPAVSADPREIRLPSAAFHSVAAECLSKAEDCLGFDPEVGLPLGYSVTVLSLAEFDRING